MIALLLTGCFSLDGLVIPGDPKEAYDWSGLDVDPALVEEVEVTAEDGTRLAGVWLHQPEPAPPLIWFHGNGGANDTYPERLAYYHAWGLYDVFAIDYRGFGTSEGDPTAAGVLEQDGLAAVRYVSDATGVAPEDIGWITLSLGGAVALHTADEVGAKGIVLESVFASMDKLLDDGSTLDLPPGWVFHDQYDNVAAIADVHVPVFIIHGQDDDFVDPAAALALYGAANDPKFIWRPDGVAHADIVDVLPDDYDARVQAFLDHPTAGP